MLARLWWLRDWLAKRRDQKLEFIPRARELVFHEVVHATVRLGLLDACMNGATTAEIATACDVKAVEILENVLDLLVYFRLVEVEDGRYRVTAKGRPLVDDASIKAWVLYGHEESGWLRNLAPLLKTGEVGDMHRTMTDDQWDQYQRAFRRADTGELLARVLELPPTATSLLDIGGASGANCRSLITRFPSLRATIIELPEAIRRASAAPDAAEWADRITYVSGDLRTTDLGREAHDVIVIAYVLHHLQPAEIEDLLGRAAAALRPGGTLAVTSMFSMPGVDTFGNALGWLLFSVASGSSTMRLKTFHEILQRHGLTLPRRLPASLVHIAEKPARPRS